jgi:soluble lytic murein transglycosylase-like protein
MRQIALLIGVLFQIYAPVCAEIFQYRGVDGRVYYTNLPSPTSPTLPTPGRHTRRTGAVAHGSTLQIIQDLARQYQVEARLVQAIITIESNFDPRAVSSAGAQGLMQLMPSTATRYQVSNPFDPRANVEGGIRYLKDLLQLFPGDLRRVLAAYNAGEKSVLQYEGVPPYPETQQYVERVLALYGTTGKSGPRIYRYRLSDGSILLTDTPR